MRYRNPVLVLVLSILSVGLGVYYFGDLERNDKSLCFVKWFLEVLGFKF